jgi:hypothetical protein
MQEEVDRKTGLKVKRNNYMLKNYILHFSGNSVRGKTRTNKKAIYFVQLRICAPNSQRRVYSAAKIHY